MEIFWLGSSSSINSNAISLCLPDERGVTFPFLFYGSCSGMHLHKLDFFMEKGQVYKSEFHQKNRTSRIHTHTHLFIYLVMHGIGLYRLWALARPVDSAVHHEISSFSGKPQLFPWGLSTAWIWCPQIIEHNLLSQQIVDINHLYKIPSPWHLD